jgi:GxxExxY protein
LQVELGYRRHHVRLEVKVDLYYRGFNIGRQRVDLMVDEQIIVEVKAPEAMPKVVMKQCLSYLRTTGLESVSS